MQRKYPIVIIGSGIAGLTAAWTLQKSSYPVLVLERAAQSGGRFSSLKRDGYTGDWFVRSFDRSDHVLAQMIRAVGLEERRVSIQGALGSFNSTGVISPLSAASFDTTRVALDRGAQALTDQLTLAVPVLQHLAVEAIRWDDERRAFWFEGAMREPLMRSDTRQLIAASGLVIATGPEAAAQLCERSPSLEAWMPILSRAKMNPLYSGLFAAKAMRTDFYGIEGPADARITWIGFENCKAPERAPAGMSLIAIHAGASLSADLRSADSDVALKTLYSEARRVLPDLPKDFLWAQGRYWNAAVLASGALQIPGNEVKRRHLTNPPGLSVSFAGDYLAGNTPELAARSGFEAARRIAAQL